MAAQDAAVDSLRDREIGVEQDHLDRVYARLEEKIDEAQFLMHDAVKRGQVGTPGALAERDAQVFRAGIHLNRLHSEFEDFLFGRVDLLLGEDGERGPDGAFTSVQPAEGAVRADDTADIAETLHIGRIGVLAADYSPLVIDWRAPAAAPFYRSTPKDPGRVVRRRVIRSRGRRVLGVEDDLMRPELTAYLDGEKLPVIGDGALMAALGQARSHTMRDIVSSIQAEQDLVIRAPAASVTEVTGGPGTGKTAVALHRAAYLLYQDRRRYAGGILIVSPTPLLVAYTEGVLPSLGEEGQVAIRAVGSLSDEAAGVAGATTYDEPAVARIKGSSRMLQVLRKASAAPSTSPPRATRPARTASSPSARRARPPPRPPPHREARDPRPPPACASSPSAPGSSWRPTSSSASATTRWAAPPPSTCSARAPGSCSSTRSGASRPAAAATPTPSSPPSSAPPSTTTSPPRPRSWSSWTPGGRSSPRAGCSPRWPTRSGWPAGPAASSTRARYAASRAPSSASAPTARALSPCTTWPCSTNSRPCSAHRRARAGSARRTRSTSSPGWRS